MSRYTITVTSDHRSDPDAVTIRHSALSSCRHSLTKAATISLCGSVARYH